jgi:cellulose synthase/poly-beta-1,6-N-acetylglucosamine synthase-like glycosyltransferase
MNKPKTVINGVYTGWEGGNSFANFSFERWLVGLANVLQYGRSFLLHSCGWEEKNKINFHQICTVLSKSKILSFIIIYLYRICLSSVFLHLLPTRL